MKKIICILAALFTSFNSFSQDLTWVKGPNASGVIGTYGTMGTSAPTNDPGGRHGAGKWVDASGNIWLFGGEGYSNNTTLCWMNDLWKYNPSTNEWTWIRGSNGPNSTGSYGTLGVAAAGNDPSAREFMACWSDASGNFWMFGGDGATGRLGDLWRYNPTTNQWTWMNGYNTTQQLGIYGTQGTPSATNKPGCRYGSAVWTDASGNFWLHGGRGLASVGLQGFLSDLWKYNPSTNQWTWVSGQNITNQYGQYGTQSVPSTTNSPGARYFSAYWADASGNFYILGGEGFPLTGGAQYLDDFWKYNPTANTWTWFKGTSVGGNSGAYGTLGLPSATNSPGGRYTAASWTDASGNFWLFGGKGAASIVNTFGELNDLFRFNPNTNEWTWMKGANIVDQNGTYGTIGVSAPSNMPGARMYNTWWRTPNGRLWILGGEGYDINQTSTDHMSDLWWFQPPCNPDSVTAAPGKKICSGTSVTLTAVNGGPSTTWYSSPTSTNSLASGTVFANPTLTAATSQSVYTYYAEANSCTLLPRASITLTVNILPTLTITSTHTAVCKGETATLSVSGANTYTWSAGQHTTSSVVYTMSTAGLVNYSVTGTSSNNCASSSAAPIQVHALPSLTVTPTTSVLCTKTSHSMTASGANSYTWIGQQTTVNSTVVFTINVTATVNFTLNSIDANGCKKDSIVKRVISDCTGLSENSLKSTVNVYPNPAKDFFTLEVTDLKAQYHFVLINTLGQVVYEQKLQAEKNVIRPNLASGIYYYKLLDSSNNKLSGRLLIE